MPWAVRILAVGLVLCALLAYAAVRAAEVSATSLWPAHSPAYARFPTEPVLRIGSSTDVHSGPGDRYLVLGHARSGDRFLVLGSSSDGRWWRIDFGGQRAWLPAGAAE